MRCTERPYRYLYAPHAGTTLPQLPRLDITGCPRRRPMSFSRSQSTTDKTGCFTETVRRKLAANFNAHGKEHVHEQNVA